MKKQVKKAIAAVAAAATFAGCVVPSASAAGKADLMKGCVYDELIEMADKSILTSYDIVNKCTKYTVIERDGTVNVFDGNSTGISGICTYSPLDGIERYDSRYYYNVQDLKGSNYTLSLEKGVMIVQVGWDYALADSTGKIISDKYAGLQRINDDYFLIDENFREAGTVEYYDYNRYVKFAKNKCGLLSADGKVIVEPQDGICGFFACGDYFIVWAEEGFYVIDKTGNKISDVYDDAYPMNKGGNFFDPLLYRGFPNGNPDFVMRRGMYDFNCADGQYIIFKNKGSKSDSYAVFSPVTGKVSSKYSKIEAVESEKYGYVFLFNDKDKAVVCDAEYNELARVTNGTAEVSYGPEGMEIELRKASDRSFECYNTDMEPMGTGFYDDTTRELRNCTISVEDNKFIARSNDGTKEKDITETFMPKGAEIIRISAGPSYDDTSEDFEYRYYAADYSSIAGYSFTYKHPVNGNYISTWVPVVMDSELDPHFATGYKHALDLGGDKYLVKSGDGNLHFIPDMKTREETTPDALKGYTDFIWLNEYSEEDPILVLYNEESGIICDAEFKPISGEIKGLDEIYCVRDDYYMIYCRDGESYSASMFSLKNGMLFENAESALTRGTHVFENSKDHTRIYDLSKEKPLVHTFSGNYYYSFSGSNWNSTGDMFITIASYGDPDDPSAVYKGYVYDLKRDVVLFEKTTGVYDYISALNGGYCAATKYDDPNSVYILDKFGQEVFGQTWEGAEWLDMIDTDENGVSLRVVNSDIDRYRVYIRYSDVTNEMHTSHAKFDVASPEDEFYCVMKDGKCGIVDSDGTEIVPVKYKQVISYEPAAGGIENFTNEAVGDVLINERTHKIKDFGKLGRIAFILDSNGKIGICMLGKAEEKSGPLGDINGDGAVDSVDASLVLAEYALVSTGGKGEFTDAQKKVADIDGNGSIDSSDASSILQFYSYVSTGGTIVDMAEWLKTVQ